MLSTESKKNGVRDQGLGIGGKKRHRRSSTQTTAYDASRLIQGHRADRSLQIPTVVPPTELLIVFNVNYTRFIDGDPQGGYAIIRPDGTCPACTAIGELRGE